MLGPEGVEAINVFINDRGTRWFVIVYRDGTKFGTRFKLSWMAAFGIR